MAEYETQFTKLFKFAPELVVTERRRVRQFIQELNLEIQEALATVQINTFTEALEKTQQIENAKAQVKAFQARKRSTPNSTYEKSREKMMPFKV